MTSGGYPPTQDRFRIEIMNVVRRAVINRHAERQSVELIIGGLRILHLECTDWEFPLKGSH